MKNTTRKIFVALLVVLALLMSMATVTVFAADTDTAEDGNVTVYFENNWLWTEVYCHYWGSTAVSDSTWPGVAMTNVGTMNGHELYSASVPSDAAGIKFSGIKNDGSGVRDESPDITSGITENAGFRMLWVDGNQVETFTYDPSAPEDPTPLPGPTGDTYTVAGVAGLCYSEWDVNDTYNDMTFNEETGLYEKTFTGIPAGSYECKVAANHSWDQSWGGDSGEFGNYFVMLTEEQDVTITFDPATGTVGARFNPSTGADDDRPTPEAPDIDLEDTITVYLGNSANWDTPKVYCWTLGSADQNATWPGVDMEWDEEKLLFYYEVPTYYVNIIFNDGNGTQTADLVIPGDGALFDNVSNEWSDLKDYEPPIPPENTTEDVTVFVEDSLGWGEVWIYFWDIEGIEAASWPGVPMEIGDDGVYYYTIPAGFSSVIFNNGGSWEDGTLLQTADLRIPTDGKTFLDNGNDFLLNDGTADDNNAWQTLGGGDVEDGGNDGGNKDEGNKDEGNTTPDDPSDDTPAGEMTFLQKMAKALLLFLRSVEEFFKNLFGGSKQ